MQSLFIETINKLQSSTIWANKIKGYRELNYRCTEIVDYITFLHKHLLDDNELFPNQQQSQLKTKSNIILVFKHFEHLLTETKLLIILPQISQVKTILVAAVKTFK